MANRIRSASEKARLVDAWRQSGLPFTTFARDNGVAPSSLARWVAARRQTDFVPVHVVAPNTPTPALLVELAGTGHRVHIHSDFDPVLLRRLAEALC